MSVFWIRSDKLANFTSDILRAYQLHKSFVEPDATRKRSSDGIDAAIQHLERHSQQCLLILDNADDFDSFNGDSSSTFTIRSLIPPSLRVLITTRDPRFVGGFASAKNALRVRPMSADEACDLLLKSIPTHLLPENHERSVDIARNLNQELGYLPLAISQAAANMRARQMKVSAYADAYESRRQRSRLMQTPLTEGDDGANAQSILITWEMSFDLVQELEPAAADCLSYMGFFDCRSVPKVILKMLPNFEDIDDVQYQEILAKLLRLSLIEDKEIPEDCEEFEIHPVVHERVTQRLSPEDFSRYAAPVVRLLARLFPYDVKLRGTAEWRTAQYLLPHALHCLSIASDTEMVLLGMPRLVQTVSAFVRHMGLTELGLHLAERALELAVESCPLYHYSSFWIWENLMHALYSEGRYGDVLQHCDLYGDLCLSSDSISSTMSETEVDNAWTNVLNHRSQCLFALRRHAEQVRMLQVMLRRTQGSTPDVKARIASIKHNIANISNHLGRFEEADQITDEQLKEADSKDGRTYISPSLYVLILREKVEAYRIGSRSLWARSQPREMRVATVRSLLPYVKKAFRIALDDSGVHDPLVWRTATCYADICDLAAEETQHEQINLWTELLNRLCRAQPWVEGQSRISLITTLAMVFGFLVKYDIPGHALRTEIQDVRATYNLALQLLDIDEKTIIKMLSTADRINTEAVALHRRGKFAEAEIMHKKAAQVALESGQVKDGTWSVIHYNTMLAIGRQPDRLDEALQYRNDYWDVIKPEEEKYGTLEKRLQQDTADQDTYAEAKRRLMAGETRDGEWWKEHAAQIERSEMRCEPLPPSAPKGLGKKSFQSSDPDASQSQEPLMSFKTKVRGVFKQGRKA